jgi:biotin carboxylase
MNADNPAPKVLLVTTDRWVPTARLAMALARAGFEVEALCPSGHPLGETNAVKRFHSYRGLAPVRSAIKAITAARPDLIIPGDDLAARHLHAVYRHQQPLDRSSTICALIAKSLGSPENFRFSFARSSFINCALEEGVRAPAMQVIDNLAELDDWIAHSGFPAVLKADGTSGGDGVKVVRSRAEAVDAFHKLQSPPLLARALKHALLDRDTTLLSPSLLRRRPQVNAQQYVDGHEATSTVACWQGTILASLHFGVLNKAISSGPATVLRRIENEEMAKTAEILVRRLKLSGLHGFDFMIESKTRNAHLIETNPRATQVGHLTLGAGHDLPAALFAAVTGNAIRLAPKLTEKDTIALFPREWLRDPESPFIASAYHDVPWDEPRLIAACVRRKQQLWSAQQAAPGHPQPSEDPI